MAQYDLNCEPYQCEYITTGHNKESTVKCEILPPAYVVSQVCVCPHPGGEVTLSPSHDTLTGSMSFPGSTLVTVLGPFKGVYPSRGPDGGYPGQVQIGGYPSPGPDGEYPSQG